MDKFNLKKIAEKSNSWPFVEARNLRDRLEKSGIDNQKIVLFETGYGPSGLPHIGTFGEVARTTIVRKFIVDYLCPGIRRQVYHVVRSGFER